ncbi:type II toxin-antitoxin system death-on-curing family toxin [Rhizobium sp. CB3060]|uniref:type II toxin-antitoxin system death-on-curing family toxin n=1 Tax=Rhizobium sp. CB3060 TaxID=3138255 RepID=UPI0021A4AFFC|nr:type II toxin-antitoxin system death-on-curing family toxin [Rhizobium tropici]UWU20154.1 type II toxin-antitoxin system death-on-curing family toxin [Rhizobium tropici]
MSNEPVWVTAEHVVHFNKRAVEKTGEPHLARDMGAIEAGIDRARNRFAYEGQTDLAVLAAHLIYGIGKAHGFEQGNKRTAWAAARYFLALNGYTLEYDRDPNKVEAAKLHVAVAVEQLMEDKISFDDVVNMITIRMVSIPKS